MRLSSIVLLAAVIPAVSTARDVPTVDRVLAGRTAGPARSCIVEPQIDDAEIFDSGAILYRMKGGPDYLNTPDNCRGVLHRDSAIASRTPSTSICRGDIIQVFDPVTHIGYGGCGLGDFIPYARVKKPRP